MQKSGISGDGEIVEGVRALALHMAILLQSPAPYALPGVIMEGRARCMDSYLSTEHILSL